MESMARWCSRRGQEHSEKKAIGTIACQAVIRESAAIANRHNDLSHVTRCSPSFLLQDIPVTVRYCVDILFPSSYYQEVSCSSAKRNNIISGFLISCINFDRLLDHVGAPLTGFH